MPGLQARRGLQGTPAARQGRLCGVRWVAPALATLVAACTVVGPEFAPVAVEAPAQWADRHGGSTSLAAPPAAGAALPADRWAVFGDPELTRLQALAQQASPDVRTAALRLLQARVEQATVSAQRGVHVGLQGAVSRERQSEYGSASRMLNVLGGPNALELVKVLAEPFTLYQAGFDASWEPDLWGRVLRSEEAAQAGTDAQRATLRQVQLGVAAELARTYFGLRAVQIQRGLAAEQLAAAQESEALLLAQVRNGLADESAWLRQRSQVAVFSAQLPVLQAQEAQAMNQITRLCGLDPGGLNEELAAARMHRSAAALPDLRLGLPGELARRRPDVAAAEARLHAATASIGIAVADLYPRVMLGASFGFEVVGGSAIGDWGGRQWRVAPVLSLPIWDQGRRKATVTLRELQQQEAAVAWQQTVLKAWHEVDDAISAYVAATQREAQLAGRARDALGEVALARARHAGGLTNVLPVLAANVAAIDAQRDLSEGTARVRTTLAALYKALGDDGDVSVAPQ